MSYRRRRVRVGSVVFDGRYRCFKSSHGFAKPCHADAVGHLGQLEVLIGNQGSDAIESHETANGIVFVERSPIDAFLHVMTVQDVWVEGAHGFRASYVRTINPILGGDRMVSKYEGWVRIP